MRCPGQDPQNWTPEDVWEAPCPSCGTKVEFFRDDASRRCPGCGRRFPNPHLDFGCAEWCQYADQCLAQTNPELLKVIAKLRRGDRKPRT